MVRCVLGDTKFNASKLLITSSFWYQESINPFYGLDNLILEGNRKVPKDFSYSQKCSNTSTKWSPIILAFLPSIWCLSIKCTSSPSLNKAMAGEEGG